MPDSVTTYFLTQGVLGITVIVLSFVIIKLYSRTVTLENEKMALLEARRSDSVETTKELVGVLKDNAQNIAILSEKIEVGKQIRRNE